MKIGIGVVLLLLVVLVASPFYIGKKIEDRAQQQIMAYQMAGFQYRLDVERSYRSSVLKYGIAVEPELLVTSYELSPSEANELSEALAKAEVKVHAQHGPILTENGFGLGWADLSVRLDKSVSPDLAEILELMNVDEFFTADTRVSLTGSGDIEFSAPRMGYVDPDTGDNLRFNGLTGQGNFSEFGREYSMNSRIQGAIVAAEFAYIAIGPISSSVQVDIDKGYTYWGDVASEFGFESIIYSSESANISISDMQISAGAEDGDTSEVGDIEYVLEVDTFDLGSLELEDIEASFAYTNIDKQFFEDYMTMALSLNPDDQESMNAEILSFFEAELPTVLAAGPGVSMPKLAFSHEGRDFDAGIDIAIDAQKIPDGFSFDPQNLFALVPALIGQLRLDADESLVNYLMLRRAENSVDASLAHFIEDEVTPEMRQELIDQQAAAMLDIAEGQGFVVKENGRVQSEISLADSALDINGKAMPLPF